MRVVSPGAEVQVHPALVAACARLRPDQAALADPDPGVQAALVVVAQCIQLLDHEITLADQQVATLVGTR